MTEEKRKGDGSRRFTLKGGKHSGFKIRVYPTYPKWQGNRMIPEHWDDLEFDGELYVHPEPYEQSATQPFLVWSKTI